MFAPDSEHAPCLRYTRLPAGLTRPTEWKAYQGDAVVLQETPSEGA